MQFDKMTKFCQQQPGSKFIAIIETRTEMMPSNAPTGSARLGSSAVQQPMMVKGGNAVDPLLSQEGR